MGSQLKRAHYRDWKVLPADVEVAGYIVSTVGKERAIDFHA